MRIALAASLCILAVLCGCVAVNLVAHRDPTSGPVAKLKLRTEAQGANHGIVRYKGALAGCECSAEPGEMLATLRNKMIFTSLGADQGKDVDEVTISVAADGNEYRFMMVVADYSGSTISGGLIYARARTCQAHVGFIPLPGRQYEAVYNFDKLPCSFDVREIKGDGSATQVAVRDYPPCIYREDASSAHIRRVKEYCAAHPEQYQAGRP